VDSFYVTDLVGHKIVSPTRAESVRRRLRTAFNDVAGGEGVRARRRENA
jgi:hypothetical protein